MIVADVVWIPHQASTCPSNSNVTEINLVQSSMPPNGARVSSKELAMKRFWNYWLSIVAIAASSTSASAQQNGVSGEIGSYQSIMSRAGINQSGYDPIQSRNGAYTSQTHASQQGVDSQGVVGGNFQAPQSQGREIDSSAPVYNGAVRSAPMSGGTGVGPSAASGAAGGQTSYFDQSCASEAADCGAACGSSANWVLGTRALFFTRNGESPVPIARNGAGGVLLSTVNDYGTMPGAEAVLTRRSCNNLGMEVRFWSLFPDQRDYTFNGPGLDSYLIGLNDFLIAPGATNVLTYFNAADDLRVYRNNEVHNLEINGLRNGGCYTNCCGKTGTYELLAGARWFQFNEDYRIAAFNGAGAPAQINYDLSTENTLLGFQVGARNECCLTDRISFLGGTRVGLFNNHSTSFQSINNENGDLAYLTGDPTAVYEFESERDSLAVLGELDLGVGYRFTQKMRATIGYRLIGVGGVALAPTQIPRNFTNNGEINRVNSNDSLILGGGYAGVDVCF
jgi:hypothetical protein